MPRNNKILIIVDQMEEGGASRVTSILLSGLLGKGYNVHLAFDKVNSSIFYTIPEQVKQIHIPFKKKSFPIAKQLILIQITRRIIKSIDPDVIIAVTFFPFFYSHFASLFSGIPVISYDHTSFGRDMGPFVNWIRYSLYNKADKLVILTEKDRRLLGVRFPQKVVVYNPLSYSLSNIEGTRTKSVLCVGRLDAWYVKGFDRIISIWETLSPKYPDWKLRIAGSGSTAKTDELKNIVLSSKAEKSIEFLGQVSNMQAIYRDSAIFALPSRVEGFPMVLLEAMSQGCVCCAFELEGSTFEIMHNLSSLIVKDGNIVEFAEKLDNLMSLFPAYDSIRKCGYDDAGRFSCQSYFSKWDTIIQSTHK